MDRVSVIIPTVQKNLLVLRSLLDSLASDPVVDEILVINNINKELIIELDKVHVLQQKENLYVNASWNLGVELAKNDIFLIINDDILPCKNLCSTICNIKVLDNEKVGLIGINNSFIKQKAKDTKELTEPVSKGEMMFVEVKNHFSTGDWGSAFFGRKRSYYKIPSDLKIIFGDNYLLYRNNKDGKNNYAICNFYFNHIHSLSSSSVEFREIIKKDIENYKKYFD